MDQLAAYDSESEHDCDTELKDEMPKVSEPTTALPAKLPDPDLDFAAGAGRDVFPCATGKRRNAAVVGTVHCQRTAKSSKSSTNSGQQRFVTGTLVPPQLRGRSNVATEDLEKLFTKNNLEKARATAKKP